MTRSRNARLFSTSLYLVALGLAALCAATAIAQDPIDPGTKGACANTTDPCVPTYHNDNYRDGVQPNEILLNSSLFPLNGAANFGFLGSNATMTSTVIDGLIYAQPLYLTGVKMATSTCNSTNPVNVVIVASENNWVYVFQVDNSTLGSFKMVNCWAKSFNKGNSFGPEYSIPFTALPLSPGLMYPETGLTAPRLRWAVQTARRAQDCS